MKRLSGILLCVMAVLLVISGCAQDGTDTSSANVSEISESPQRSMLKEHMGERDMDGFELRILATSKELAFCEAQYVPSELTGDPVNGAVYERNNILEELYNCKLSVIFVDPHATVEDKVRNDTMAGDVDYNVVSTGVSSLSALAVSGAFTDLYSIEDSNLCLYEEWWDQQAVKQLSIDNKLFFACGDILFTDDERTHMLFFNKGLIEENELEDPYRLVRDNEWTLDVLHEMVRAAAKDAGDGQMDVDSGDTWGYIGAAFDCYKFILGCNATMVTKDENDIPVISVMEEKNVEAFEKAFSLITDSQHAAYIDHFFSWDDAAGRVKFFDQFYNGKALFCADNICALNSEKMLNSDVDYGVLPLPKYDSSQDNYACTIDPYWFTCVAIPRVEGIDTDKTTFLLEAMAYYNRENVTPLYYETTLKSKRLLDDSSEQMLDIIFSNRIMDLANIYNWNDCIQYYNSLVFMNSNGVVSYMEGKYSGMQQAMNETIEAFRKIS